MFGNLRHSLFIVSILLKGVFAVLEILAGATLLVSSPGNLKQFVYFMFRNRLVADPNDPFATYALHLLQDFDMTRHTFVSIYLMLHGLVKLGVVAGLYSERLWAFPISLTALGIFIVYQMERYISTNAPLLLVISVLDAFIMVLAWREYQALKKKAA
jgi:uncharacterized membrane protein